MFLFGSRGRDEGGPLSDTDVALVLEPGGRAPRAVSQKRLDYLADCPDLDVRIFQQVPIYIRQRILKDGKVLFCRDEDRLYEEAFKVIREFSDFEHIYREYLEEVKNGG